MPELPVPYDPSVDQPYTPIQGVEDQRVLDIAAKADELKQLMRDLLPGSPYVEQALRHVDLGVQAAHQATTDGVWAAAPPPEVARRGPGRPSGRPGRGQPG